MAALQARSTVSRSFFGAKPVTRVSAAVRPVVAARQPAVVTKAFFGFGGSKASSGDAAAPQYYICIDCGYIYPDGDFKKAPGSYRCPVCNSPKGRFKVYKGAVKGKPNNTGAAIKQRFQARQW
ncbi:hypothetical protein OEZ86_000872 [Tetradesmus obliquus]|uniref:Uncharacterized protein n=2 Tax=Tetradesmus obliquus TaxID=3088 RepID=A0A383WJK6_TETOB|nr:hypothetical protein OEZ85_010948 [Tetradesmus obliquus]WIA30814.1 hypothetical protein OEZ86_000872 [Tetradesmus obliquus]|eukprot:jgi/Sobl393_1/17847/SZX77402.1